MRMRSVHAPESNWSTVTWKSWQGIFRAHAHELDTARDSIVTSDARLAPSQLPADTDPARWRTLALLAVTELLGMSLWFSGSAVAPILQERWSLTGAQVGWLTTAVQLGFVAGTAVSAILNLADILPA